MQLRALSQIRGSILQITEPFGPEQWSIRFIPAMQSAVPVPVWLRSKVVSCHSITWKVVCRIVAAIEVCSGKEENVNRLSLHAQNCIQICQKVKNEHPKQKRTQLSELFNERKTLCAEFPTKKSLAGECIWLG